MRWALSLISCLCLAPHPGGVYAEDFTNRIAMEERSAATFYVSVQLGGYGTEALMVDTGSGYMTINEATLDALKREGAARYVKQLQGVLADGSELEVPVYTIARVAIGGSCWLRDVEAAVFPGASRQILGLSALRKAAPFIFSVEPPELVLSRCGTATSAAKPLSDVPPPAFAATGG